LVIVCFDIPIFFLGVERSKQHKHRYLYPCNSSETIAFMEGAGMPSATSPPPALKQLPINQAEMSMHASENYGL